MDYFRKMCGCGRDNCRPGLLGLLPRPDISETLWSFIGALCGIGVVAWLCDRVASPGDGFVLIGSFGASAVLAYGAPGAPFSQPRNLLGGHVLSALVGVFVARNLGVPGMVGMSGAEAQMLSTAWLAPAVAVAAAIALMHLTDTLHPPGGATALIAVTGSPQIQALGYKYAVVPVAAGAAALLVVALLVNNIPRGRRYPRHWW